MKLIVNMSKDMYEKVMKTNTLFDEYSTGSILSKIIQDGTPILDNTTNGDVVKTLFSDTLDNFCERTTWKWNHWWNTPYKIESEE